MTLAQGVDALAQRVGEELRLRPTLLPLPNQLDEANAAFFYFGYENVDGSWLIRLQDRATSQTLNATSTNNPAFIDLAASFPNRETLVYE